MNTDQNGTGGEEEKAEASAQVEGASASGEAAEAEVVEQAASEVGGVVSEGGSESKSESAEAAEGEGASAEEVLAVLLTEVADAESTGPLSGGGTASKITTPLPEAGGAPRPPLAEGSTVNQRYEVAQFVGTSGETNLYRVADLQGYMRCWACGATSSMPGDIYCVECGAQLAGRHYRLQEFLLTLAGDDEGRRTDDEGRTVDGGRETDEGRRTKDESVVGNGGGIGEEVGFLPQLKVAPAILENRVVGVTHAYDVWYDLELGRGYVAWEEAGGRLMAQWLPGMTTTSLLAPGQSGHLAVPQEPEEEQALGWMAQVGDLLVRLHAENIGGCALELANLLVQPGDRVMLMDPSGCQSIEGLDEDAKEALQRSDVRALAGELEQWYMAVRKGPSTAVEGEEGVGPVQGRGASCRGEWEDGSCL